MLSRHSAIRELRTVGAMKILDPLSGREVDLRPSVDTNAFTPSVRVPQDEVRSPPLLKAGAWRPDAELQRARTSTPLRGLQNLRVVLGALCISGGSRSGITAGHAPAEREKITAKRSCA